MVTVTAISFPRDDEVFARHVAEIMGDVGAAGSEAVERRIRRIYPSAVVREQEALGSLGMAPVWYFYRDGQPLSDNGGDWWQRADAAAATFKDGAYVAADEAFCALHGLPPAGIVGRRWDEFADSEAVAEAERLWQAMIEDGLLADGRAIQSTFLLCRADGLRQPVEYRTQPNGDGTFRTWMRPVGEPIEDRVAERAGERG